MLQNNRITSKLVGFTEKSVLHLIVAIIYISTSISGIIICSDIFFKWYAQLMDDFSPEVTAILIVLFIGSFIVQVVLGVEHLLAAMGRNFFLPRTFLVKKAEREKLIPRKRITTMGYVHILSFAIFIGHVSFFIHLLKTGQSGFEHQTDLVINVVPLFSPNK